MNMGNDSAKIVEAIPKERLSRITMFFEFEGDCKVVLGWGESWIAETSGCMPADAAQAAIRSPAASQEKVATSKRARS